MKARVIRAYTDRLDGTIRCLGTTVDLSEARMRELSSRGFVEPNDVDASQEAGAQDVEPDDVDAAPEEGAPETDLDDMTAAQLRDLIAERGGSAPKKATKARLVEIARAL